MILINIYLLPQAGWMLIPPHSSHLDSVSVTQLSPMIILKFPKVLSK